MTQTTSPRPAPVASTGFDWRLDIPESRRALLRIWLWSIAAMTLAVLIVGGITRLTQSGLSIVDWKPLMGVIPPLGEAQWMEKFELYRQYPEYQQLRRGMTLEEFKFIFFWEYLHRLVARMIGLVFLVPFLWFAVRRFFNRQFAARALALFALGAGQGVLGWVMVQSGLVERPSVSHFRLAAHLSLAFVIFGYAVWLARELRLDVIRHTMSAASRRLLARALAAIGILFALQVVWGAFVAGMRAGRFYNTFPLMGGRLVPRELLGLEPALRNFVENPIAVQWTHRVLGTVLAAACIALFVQVRRLSVDTTTRRYNVVFLAMIGAQYLLGVLTLLYAVPVTLGVMHQAAAMIIFGVWLSWLHHVVRARPLSAPAASS